MAPMRDGHRAGLSMLGSARLCFGSPEFRLNFLTMFIVFAGIGALEFVLPFYFQDAHGLPQRSRVMLFLPAGDQRGRGARLYGVRPAGARFPPWWGSRCTCAACCWWARSASRARLSRIVLCVGLMSCGTSIFQSPNNALFMDSAPLEALGFAGSVSGLARYAGMAIGISGCSALLYGRMSAEMGRTVTHFVEGRPGGLHGGVHVRVPRARLCVARGPRAHDRAGAGTRARRGRGRA